MSSFHGAVFILALDELSTNSQPVGVVLWSEQRNWVKSRFVDEREELPAECDTTHGLPFVDLVREKIAHWTATRTLPYCEKQLTPSQDEWWRHVRQLLIHSVQLSEPFSIDCRDPESEFDALFRRIVMCRSTDSVPIPERGFNT